MAGPVQMGCGGCDSYWEQAFFENEEINRVLSVFLHLHNLMCKVNSKRSIQKRVRARIFPPCHLILLAQLHCIGENATSITHFFWVQKRF